MQESAHKLTQLVAIVDKDFSTIGALFHKVIIILLLIVIIIVLVPYIIMIIAACD